MTSLPFTHTIYTLITHKCMKGHSKRKTLDRFSTTHTPIFQKETYSSLVRIHCSPFSFPLHCHTLRGDLYPNTTHTYLECRECFGAAGKHWKKPRMADATWSLFRDLESQTRHGSEKPCWSKSLEGLGTEGRLGLGGLLLTHVSQLIVQ